MNDDKSVEAQFGERMIEVKIKFWTDNISGTRGRVIPKRAWDSGMVLIERNAPHGIVPGKPMPFHSLMDLSRCVEKVLIAQGVTLQLNARARKYLASPGTGRKK